MAAAVIISVYSSTSGENPRRKNRQCRSVQSIMGATDTLRSSFSREQSAETPTFIGIFESGVSAVFLGIPGSLAFAKGSYRGQEYLDPSEFGTWHRYEHAGRPTVPRATPRSF